MTARSTGPVVDAAAIGRMATTRPARAMNGAAALGSGRLARQASSATTSSTPATGST